MKEYYGWSVKLTSGTDVKTPIIFIGKGSGERAARYISRLVPEQGIDLSTIQLDLVELNDGSNEEQE